MFPANGITIQSDVIETLQFYVLGNLAGKCPSAPLLGHNRGSSGFFTSVTFRENQSRNETMSLHTDRCTDRCTDARKTISSSVRCYAIAMEQINLKII